MILRIAREKVGHRQGPIRRTPHLIEVGRLHLCRIQAMKGLAACAVLLFATHAAGQEIEPRTYSNAPIGVNFLIAGYAYTRGALQFDSALDLTDAHLKTSNAVVAYARAF